MKKKKEKNVTDEFLSNLDSEEEMDSQLLNAIKIHKQRKNYADIVRNEEKMTPQKQENLSFSDSQTEWKILNYSEVDYEKQGATPKKLSYFEANKKNSSRKAKKNKDFCEEKYVNCLSSDIENDSRTCLNCLNNFKLRISSLNNFNEVMNTKLSKNTMHRSESLESIIMDRLMATKDFAEEFSDCFNVNQLSDINFSYEKSLEHYFNIEPEPDKNRDVLTLRAVVMHKIKKLKCRFLLLIKVLQLMRETEFINKFLTFFSGEKVYEKKLNCDLLVVETEEEFTIFNKSLVSVLFPESDEKYLREKIEECGGDLSLIENFVEEEHGLAVSEEKKVHEDFARLLSELPNHDIKFLYRIWLELVGDKEKIEEFITMEKEAEKLSSIQTSLLIEFPDLEEEVAMRIARDYTSDEEGLKSFVESEKYNRKIENLVEIMQLALPETSKNKLRRKCKELKGDEDMVYKYIEKVKLEYNLQDKILQMQSLLPDADPKFLREKIESTENHPDIINNLTFELLEENNYPKLVENELYQERVKLWRTYVDNFTVKNYLYKIPNPDKFETDTDENNETDPNLALEFLQKRYPSCCEEDLEEFFEVGGRNIVKTCEYIEGEIQPVSLAVSGFSNAAYDELFLKKVTYIDHREEIKKYLQETQSMKEVATIEAQINESFLECSICSNAEVIPFDVVSCPDGHVFCRSCVTRYVEITIGEGVYKFQCLSPNCQTNFSNSTLENLLPECVFSKIYRKQQIAELGTAGVEGLEFCPFCDFAYIPNKDDALFICQNKDCLEDSCRKCREKSHIPLKCEDIEKPQGVEARKKIEESMTNKLCRQCPTCGKKFVKIDGCNLMKCPCGANICYICRKLVDGYNHFKDNNRESGICPLYTENTTLHVTDVIIEGQKVRDAILKENPDVQILNDPTVGFN